MSEKEINEIFNKAYPTVANTDQFKIIGPVTLPTKLSNNFKSKVKAYLFAGKHENYLVCKIGKIEDSDNVFVRISSACLFGFICKSMLCDCHDQFEEAIELMSQKDSGILIYAMDQHGKGIGIEAHFLVYAEGQRQNMGLFKEIYEQLGLKNDYRDYDEAMDILSYLKNTEHFKKITMLTEAPQKMTYFINKFEELAIPLSFHAFTTKITPENSSELSEKVALGYIIKDALDQNDLLSKTG